MSKPSHYSYRELADWLQEPGRHIALLPVGCTEQHGPVLPLSTDSLIARELAARLSRRWNHGHAFVLPALDYTPTEPNKDFAGTVSVPNDLLRPYLEAVLRGVMRTPYGAVAIVNSHGSVDAALKEIAFKLVLEQFEAGAAVRPILALNAFDVWGKIEQRFGQAPGRHADWTEFLMTYGLLGRDYYDDERLERLRRFAESHDDFGSKQPRIYGIPAQFRTADGVQGEPLPRDSSDWESQARAYWQFVEDEAFSTLESELLGFQARFCSQT